MPYPGTIVLNDQQASQLLKGGGPSIIGGGARTPYAFKESSVELWPHIDPTKTTDAL